MTNRWRRDLPIAVYPVYAYAYYYWSFSDFRHGACRSMQSGETVPMITGVPRGDPMAALHTREETI
jgi:hypothetical protein